MSIWTLPAISSRHITGSTATSVVWESDHCSQVTGLGELQLRTCEGKLAIVQNVLHLPDASHTVVSRETTTVWEHRHVQT